MPSDCPHFTIKNPDQPLSDAAIAVLADLLLKLVDQTEKTEAAPAPTTMVPNDSYPAVHPNTAFDDQGSPDLHVPDTHPGEAP